MAAASLDRRIEVLEARLRPPPPRRVVFVTGMARPGHRWLPNACELPGGAQLVRDKDEHPDAFLERGRLAALAASCGPVVVIVATGTEVPQS